MVFILSCHLKSQFRRFPIFQKNIKKGEFYFDFCIYSFWKETQPPAHFGANKGCHYRTFHLQLWHTSGIWKGLSFFQIKFLKNSLFPQPAFALHQIFESIFFWHIDSVLHSFVTNRISVSLLRIPQLHNWVNYLLGWPQSLAILWISMTATP